VRKWPLKGPLPTCFVHVLKPPQPTQIKLAQDAAGRLPSVVWPDAQEALFQEAEFQEALFQEALFQEAEFQEALFQEALFQEAFAWAALDQLAASKLSPPFGSLTRKLSRPAFGFGGARTAAAALACASPTPSA